MVKSKRMSKTSIAVIVLALLLVLSMVLGLTGAWFTQKSAASSTASNNLVFGGVGSATITATGVKHLRWDPTAGTNSEGDFVEQSSGTKVMPGDKVTAGGVTIAHSVGSGLTASTESKIYFLIAYDNGSGLGYYITSATDSDSDGLEASEVLTTDVLVAVPAQNAAAQELQAGQTLVISGQVLSIKIGNDYYALDGDRSGSGLHSSAIPTSEQGKALNTYDAKVGDVVYNKAGVTYKIAIMQTTNESATDAFSVLSALLAAN